MAINSLQGLFNPTLNLGNTPESEALSLLAQGVDPINVSIQTGLNFEQLQSLMDRPTTPPTTNKLDPLSESDLAQFGPELSNYLSTGKSLSNLADEGIRSLTNNTQGMPLEAPLIEKEIVDTVNKLGIMGKDENTPTDDLQNTIDANTGTALANANKTGNPNDINNAQRTLQANLSIIDLLGDSPEDRKKAMNIYRDAASIIIGDDDYSQFVRTPDKAMPYLVAGMSLIESGADGDDWGSSLTKAFTKYVTADKAEKDRYGDTLLKLKLDRKKTIDNFATQLALSDISTEQAIKKQLMTQKTNPFIIDGESGVQYLTESNKRLLNNAGINFRPYSAEFDTKLDNFTLTAEGGSSVHLLTQAQANDLRKIGFRIEKGDTLKNQVAFYDESDNFLGYDSKANIDARIKDGEKINIKTFAEVPATDTETGRPIYVSRNVLNPKSDAYDPRYVRQETGMSISTDENGNLIVETGGGTAGSSLRNARQTIKPFEDKFGNTYEGASIVLDTADRVKKLIESGDVVFGVAGAAVSGVQRVIDEINAASSFLSNKNNFKPSNKNRYNRLFIDKNGNGERDEGEDVGYDKMFKEVFDTGGFNDMFGFSPSALKNARIKRSELQAAQFRLALANAMLLGQRSRDISDKDLVYQMKQIGADATSSEQLFTVLDRLENDAINRLESTFNQYYDNMSMGFAPAPNGKSFRELMKEQRDALYNRPISITDPNSLNIYQRIERQRERLSNENAQPITTFLSVNPGDTDAVSAASTLDDVRLGNKTYKQHFDNVGGDFDKFRTLVQTFKNLGISEAAIKSFTKYYAERSGASGADN